MSPQVLFVYGTLRGDSKNEMFQVLARDAKFLGEGKVRGRLFSLGPYPGMALSDSDDGSVRGELYQVRPERWQQVIRELDSYEGCGPDDPEPHEYRRALVDVVTASGRKVPAWAYLLNRPTAHLEEIPSGDYLSWRASAERSRR